MNIRDLIPWNWGKRQVPVRREQSQPLQSLQNDINRAFDSFWRGFDLPWPSTSSAWSISMPSVDVSESDKEIEVTAELPGIDEKDIDISLAEGVLTIRGEKKSEVEKKEKDYYLQERTFGSIERVVPLPDTIDLDSANATFKNGVLTVKLAKKLEAAAATKRITVRRA
ncbi:Hsp20/alpha crystallin family protein [Bradyrhizobium sp.]|jgi:HSP20 family protein|uniref:Hsp20/alpha crystallin family protein n=1 Tax=Bradyrhizobium sp. TaxID=376 RepID=UPI00391BBADA